MKKNGKNGNDANVDKYRTRSIGTFTGQTNSQLALMRYTKTSCGVDFLLNTADSSEKAPWFHYNERYQTDFFEFYFFRQANGWMVRGSERIDLHGGMLLIISPFQHQEWHTDDKRMDYTFLVFQEEFVNNFFSDQYFMYRLFYCYQNDLPTYFDITHDEAAPLLTLLCEMKTELHNPVADSYQMILAYLYEFLLKLNRLYARRFNLNFPPPRNNYAFQYKRLLEQNIRKYNRVEDYADMMHISRVTLNTAVMKEFGVTANHLLKQRLLQEVKQMLLFTDSNINEIAYQLNFSEPNHMMRFFKAMTGITTTEFVTAYLRDGHT